jgi:hypothetical protein
LESDLIWGDKSHLPENAEKAGESPLCFSDKNICRTVDFPAKKVILSENIHEYQQKRAGSSTERPRKQTERGFPWRKKYTCGKA